MRFATKLAIAVGFAVVVLAATAKGQTPTRCGPRADILKQLASLYQEQPVAVGISDTGALVEVLASKDGATFTVLSSRANGVSCVIMAGEQWQQVSHMPGA